MSKSKNLDALITKFINEYDSLLMNASSMTEEVFRKRQVKLVKNFLILAKLIPFNGDDDDE